MGATGTGAGLATQGLHANSTSKLAATLDPRDFNTNELLAESHGPVNLDFNTKKALKRASSNARLKDRDPAPGGHFAQVNNFLTMDEPSPRYQYDHP